MRKHHPYKGEQKMKSEDEIHTAWIIWDLMTQLSDLLWDRYDKEFVERYIKIEEEKYWKTHSDKNLLSD